MRILLIAAVLCLGVGKPAPTHAGDRNSDARTLTGWEAVGRLNMDGRSMCTGALIAPDLVLTAAHCLFDPYNGKSVDPRTIRFEAGLVGGRAKATRMVADAVAHPGYEHRRTGQAQLGYDIAVLKLAEPISSATIRPLATDARPDRGDRLGVVSYTEEQASTPILQRPCEVLARQADTLVMNCEVEFGASGAPVFAIQGGETPRLVSVIAAKAAMGGRPVSVGTVLDRALQVLLKRAG